MRKRSPFTERSSHVLASTLLFGSVAGLIISTGCGSDPVYGVTSTWLLNGATPDATRCNELGISRFRLTMDGPGPATSLEANCAETIRIGDATYGGFETSRAFDYGVEYTYTVDALDAAGEVLYRYDSQITAYYGDYDPVDLNVVDVFEPAGSTASFSAQWVFSGGDVAADCEVNQIETVALWITSATDPNFEDATTLAEAPCASGIIKSDGKVLARGDYYIQYVALDNRGAIAELSEQLSALVVEPGDLALPRHQFEGL